MDLPSVSIIIVTYNSKDHIGYSLDISKLSVDRGFAEVIVVDNDSQDGTAAFISENYPWVNLIASSENLGFGRACNLGFENAQAPYVLFLNPDASIADEHLRTLTQYMSENPQAGIVAPATEVYAGFGDQAELRSYQFVGALTTPGSLMRHVLGRGDAGRRVLKPGEPDIKTNWVCGGVMMMPSALFSELEGFDPRFFLYYEETDLCLRTQRAGYEIWALGNAVATHSAGASSKNSGKELIRGFIVEHHYASRFYYLVKNFGWLKAIATESACMTIEFSRWLKKTFVDREQGLFNPIRRPFLSMPPKLENSAD